MSRPSAPPPPAHRDPVVPADPSPPPPTPADLETTRVRRILSVKAGEYGCTDCGFKTRHFGDPAVTVFHPLEAVGVRHQCDPSDLVKWKRKTAPPRPLGTPRPMIALRRALAGENFDVVFVPAVEVSGMKVLAEDEGLDYAMQKIMDVIPDEMPFIPHS